MVLPTEFAPELVSAQLTQTIERLRAAIQLAHPNGQHVFSQPTALSTAG